MRFLLLLLLLSFFGFSGVLPASAQHAATKKVKVRKAGNRAATVRAVPAPSAGPVLTFERTPCNGNCPAYLMQVYANGRVAYEGRRTAPLLGKHDFKLPAAAVADMLRQASAAHFETFEKRYAGYTSDLPGTIVAIRQPNGALKTVTVTEGAPENVKRFFAYIGGQLDQLAQANGLEK